MSELIRLLLVEDNQADVGLIREMLPETGTSCFRIESVPRLSEALNRLKDGDIDLALVDLGLPDSQGISTFRTLHKAAPGIPLIVLTGNADHELAVTAVKEGAQDYLVKGEVVGNVVMRAARYAVERKRAEDAIQQGIAKIEASRRTLLSVVEDQKRTEDQLRESEEKFRNVFENSAIGKSITSLDGSVSVNPAFCQMLGYTKEELSHQKWQNISHPDDYELTQNNLKGLQSGEKKSTRFIKRYFKKDGSVVWADVNTVLQRDKEGKPLYYITAVIDITERKHAENKIDNLNNELFQKNAELEQLIYIASHDLRTPLVNVQGFSKELGILVKELAEIISHAGLSEKQQARTSDIVSKEFPEARNYILASVIKMDSLLKGLLKISRLGRASVTLHKINMDEMLSGVIKTLGFQAQQSGARVEIAALPPCIGDPVQVDQVFTNLIDNAIKYLSPGRPGIIRITGKSGNGISEYCVEDNGIGIASEHQAKVFDIFHRLDPQMCEGEGLGLAIVKKIVSRLSGNVRIESELGKGSRFIVTLPEG